MREVGRNLNKLVRELKNKQSPEAMVYLRLFGNELGYLRTNQMEEMAYSAAMMIDNMFKMFPADVRKSRQRLLVICSGVPCFHVYLYLHSL